MALQPNYAIPDPPPPDLIETPQVLKSLARAHRYLAELKGRAAPSASSHAGSVAIRERS